LFFYDRASIPGEEFLMGARRIRREQRRYDMAESRRTNGMLKMKERIRRHNRMLEMIKKGKLPFTPPVMSWLSAELNKPARQIVQADVERLLQQG
jgi:hypothetical protein